MRVISAKIQQFPWIFKIQVRYTKVPLPSLLPIKYTGWIARYSYPHKGFGSKKRVAENGAHPLKASFIVLERRTIRVSAASLEQEDSGCTECFGI